MRSEFENILAIARTLTVEDVAAFLADLECVRISALGVLMRPAAPAPDQNIGVAETAKRMGVSKNWLYRNSAKFKFARRIGRKLLFSSAGLDSYLKKLR